MVNSSSNVPGRPRFGPRGCWIGWLVLAVALPGTALARDDEPVADTLGERSQKCQVTVCVPGQYQLRYFHLSDFPIDGTGKNHDVNNWGTQRWRIRPKITFAKDVFIEAEADLFTGRLAGDTTRDGREFLLEPQHRNDAFSGPRATDFRTLYLSWTTPIGLLRIGQQSSQFGLGILANDGNDESHTAFADTRLGDLSERVLFATKPLFFLKDNPAKDALILAGGFDVVFRDDNANLVKGDLALQGIVSLMWRTDPLTAGLYAAFRRQTDKDGSKLDANAIDFFVRWVRPFDALKAKLTIAAELAILIATTDRIITDQATTGVDVLGVGGVLQTTFDIEVKGHQLSTRLELGFATGDNNRLDKDVRSFTFDPAYQVGMILFQEVMQRVSARSVELASDPNLSAKPVKGLEFSSTNGAITNAVYVNPVFRWRGPFGLGADLGLLFAWSAADVIDPWQTNGLHGGFNTNFLGAPAKSHWLGTEVDLGLSYRLPVRDLMAFVLSAQYGVYVPGSAFESPRGGPSLDPIHKVRTSFTVAW